MLVPSLNFIIAHRSWQDASLVSGIAYLVFLMPLTLFFRNRPEDMGLLPDGDSRPPVLAGAAREASGRAREIRDYTVKEALRTPAYWLLLAGAGLRQAATLGILVSIVPILETKGVSRQEAANLTGFMFGINFLSRLIVGYLGDRWPKSYLLFGSLMLESVGLACLYFGQWSGVGIVLLLAFILLQGLGDGAGIIVWAAMGEYFGRNRFATLRGYITFSHSWALIASPVFAGWVFDKYGSFDWAIGPGAVCAAVAGLCFLAIKKPLQLSRGPAAESSLV